jgi:predicted CopG family antitoxin
MPMPIRIKRETIEDLKRLKFHPRETYDDVIKRLIEAWKERTHS